MPQSDWKAGYEMVLTIGEPTPAAYPFATVEIDRHCKMINRANSKYAPGYEVWKGGIKGLTFTLEGPWKEGEVPVQERDEHTWVYKPSSANVGLSFLGVIESVRHNNDVEDGPRMQVVVRASDTFGAVFV